MAHQSPNTDHSNPRLNAVIAEIMKREDEGQPVDRQAMILAYPDLADGLRSYFQGEAMMGGFAVAETVLPRTPTPQTSTPRSNVRETVRPGTGASDTASEFRSRSFGRYQLLRPVGEGAMGSVFLAHDASLDRQVALKIPKVEGKSAGEFLARFAREAKAAAGLKHPNICSVFDTGEQDGVPYITMEFIDGFPLSRFVGSSQLRSIDSILQMVATIAEAVEHAHSKGIIHRDLKPGNILVDADFKPYVTDFGLARRINSANESRMTQEGLIIGTPAYMAPEQVRGEQAKVGPRSDVYSLGAILFELLTSRLPFEGNVAEILSQVLRDHPPSPSKFRKELTDDVDDLCVRMLRKDPEKRFSSMKDVLTAIVQLRQKLKRAPLNSADVARQQSPFEIEKAHIEQMLTKGQYAAAIRDLEKLAKETLPGAKAAAEWARKKLPGVRAEAKALSPAGLTALLQTAQQLFAKHDYPGVIQLLEDVPSLRRTEAMEELLEKAHAKESEAERLLDEIKDRERSQNLDGIESLVKRLLKLKPGNSYVKRLSEALQTYSKTPATRRTYRYEKGRLQPMPEPGFLRQWAMLASLVGVLVFLTVYYYTFRYVHSNHEVSAVPDINPSDIEKSISVQIDGDWLTENGGQLTLVIDGREYLMSKDVVNSNAYPISISDGDHSFLVKRENMALKGPETFTLTADTGNLLRIDKDTITLLHNSSVPGFRITPEKNSPLQSPPDHNVVESGTVPNKEFGTLEKDLPAPEAILVGFDVTEGIVKVGIDAKVISSIKPLYRNQAGALLENAKTYGVRIGPTKRLGNIPFYAVSALRVVGAVNSCVDSLEVTFRPIDRFTTPLNASDVITAKAGGTGGASCPILGQNGKLSVGLLVRSSESGITGIGLIQPSKSLDAASRETWLIRTGESFGHSWHYRTTDAEFQSEWFGETLPAEQRGFWFTGKGPFGQGIDTIQTYGTPWNFKYIYLRTTFEMPELDAATDVVLRQVHDDDTWIWINGKEADLSGPSNPHSYLWGFQHQYSDIVLGDKVRSLLKPGVNTIAVKSVQNTLGQVIDIGLKLVPGNNSVTSIATPAPQKADSAPTPAPIPFITPKPKTMTPMEYAKRAQSRYARKEYADAIDDLKKAQAGDVTNIGFANDLAWYLSTVPEFELRDGRRAVELASIACSRTEFKNPRFLDTLACAYAETKDFKNAVKWQKQALKLAPEPEKLNYESHLNRFLGERPIPDTSRDPIVLIKRGMNGGHEWHYNHTRYTGSDWTQPVLRDEWPIGISGFGSKRTYGNMVNTEWNKSDSEIYLRTQIRISTLAGRVVVLDSQHDDTAKIYVNGKLAIDFKGFGSLNSYVFDPDKQAYFREGTNDIAVQCKQRGDTNSGNPQVIDIGLRLE